MNAVNAVSIVYVLAALASISVLSYTFRKKIDASGKFFLLAEVAVLPVVLIINLAHGDAYFNQWFYLAVANGAYFLSEVLIFLSIYTLGRHVRRRFVFATLGCAFMFFVFAEFMRWTDPSLSPLIYPIGFAICAFATYRVCSRCEISSIKENPFYIWIKYVEAALVAVSVVRIGGFFIIGPVAPLSAHTSSSLFIALMVTMNVSRYVSYQSFRISWINSAGESENFLNRSLALSNLEIERLRDKLISSNKLLSVSALASTIVHELSQPLTSAALQTETIRRSLQGAPVEPSLLVNINAVSLQLTSAAERLKKLRQLFAAKNEEFRPFYLQDICDEVAELVRFTEKLGSVELHLDYQASPLVYGDPTQIQQVLINMIDNALEAIDEARLDRGEISLVVSQSRAFACLSVRDSGPGIREDMLPVIFDLYKTSKSDGIGIGLWLSKIILNNHCGFIKAANNPGGGALFEIGLPLAEQSA